MNKRFKITEPLIAVTLLLGTAACSSAESSEGNSASQTSTSSSSAAPVSAESQEKINLEDYPTDDREALIWTVNKVLEASELDARNFNDRNADRVIKGDTLNSMVEFGAKEYPNTMSLTHPEVFEHAAGGTEDQFWMPSAPFDFAQKFRDAPEGDVVKVTFDPSHINYLTEDRVWLGAGSFKTTINGVEEAFTTDPAYDPDFDYRYMLAKDADGKWKMASSMMQNNIRDGFWQTK